MTTLCSSFRPFDTNILHLNVMTRDVFLQMWIKLDIPWSWDMRRWYFCWYDNYFFGYSLRFIFSFWWQWRKIYCFIFISRHFVDISPYEQVFFPKRIIFEQKKWQFIFKIRFRCRIFHICCLWVFKILLFNFFLCYEAIFSLMSFISILFVIDNCRGSHLFWLKCSSSDALGTFIDEKCFWLFFFFGMHLNLLNFFQSSSSSLQWGLFPLSKLVWFNLILIVSLPHWNHWLKQHIFND